MRYEPARHILQTLRANSSQDDFFVRHYNMNLYRGCSHGCIYCDARSLCYRLDTPGEVRAKQNALEILREELRRKRTPGIVGMGGMSDGYNPEESTACITRGALSLLSQYGFGIGITTKSPLVARDIDILRSMQRYSPVHVTFSITAMDDALSLLLEPGVLPSSARFDAMARLADAGIPTGIWINPVLPFLTDSWANIHALLRAAKEAGACYAITHYGMTLREGNREYFYAALDSAFPGMKEQYIRSYGNAYMVPSPDVKALYSAFTAACDALSIAHTFAETNKRILQSGGVRQQGFL